jgi:pimeloyl-ACP methyl ester carboxylesterase
MTTIPAADPAPARLPVWQRHPLGFVLAVVGGVLLVGILLVLLLPAGAAPYGRAPAPAESYQEAVARFEQVTAAEAANPRVRSDCRSRLLDHGEATRTVVVLFHGYTNCPKQYDQLAEQLQALGATVYVPRAPFHGEDPANHSPLASLHAEDLETYANNALDLAAGLGDRVVVMGLSGGGTVTSYLAQTRPEVDLAIPISAFLGLPSVPEPLTPGLVNATAVLPVIDARDPNPDEARRGAFPHGFADTSMQGAAAYMRLAQAVLAQANTTAPAAARVTTVVNDADTIVNNPMIESLAARWERQAGDAVETVHLDAALGLIHDLVTPDRDGERIDIVYPRLLELVGQP